MPVDLKLPKITMYKSGAKAGINLSDKADWEAKGWSDSESPAPKKTTKKTTKKWGNNDD